MWAFLLSWQRDAPPILGASPSYGQMRKFCRWQARQFRQLVRAADAATAQRAQAQAEWIDDVLGHHPLLDDLQRTIQQSADLLHALVPDKFTPNCEITKT